MRIPTDEELFAAVDAITGNKYPKEDDATTELLRKGEVHDLLTSRYAIAGAHLPYNENSKATMLTIFQMGLLAGLVVAENREKEQ